MSDKHAPNTAPILPEIGTDPSVDLGQAGLTEPAADTKSDQDTEPSVEHRFPIVGIGASAGGLAAFEAFFSAIPTDLQTGMAFVLVQHLAPDHKSILTDLVQRYTRMAVMEVEDGMAVRPDCAYIIPPKLDMALFNGKLHLFEPSAPRGLRLPIDFFFRSLAQDQHEQAICVVLSGTGSDGTLGARAIKGEGGMVMVQTPSSAAYDGMPRSVLATGLTDFVLSPEQMPAQIIAYVRHAFRNGQIPVTQTPKSVDILTRTCILLRDKTGHDFSQYKQSTLVRRIERRMALHQIDQQGDYVRYLQEDPAEIEALFRDLLIGVTSFFRDPPAFELLEREVIPKLFSGKPAGAAVRVWVCGCSTGEEAYSIAILLQEHMEHLRQTFKLQIFATDIDARAITQARAGVYPASIVTDVSAQRLTRYFTLDSERGTYRIHKSIRDLLVFSEQDLIKDPPFSRLDLISCRNLLIYLDGTLQKRLIPLFHYALNPDGVLFLGSSESIGDTLTLFNSLDRKWKIYVKRESLANQEPPALGAMPSARDPIGPRSIAPLRDSDPAGKPDLRTLTEQALLRHYDPAAVLTNERSEILYIHGRTGQYLEPAAGSADMNLFTMAREGLSRDLTLALQRTVARKESLHVRALKVRTNGDWTTIDLSLHPLRTQIDGHAPDLYLVVFEPAAATPKSTRATKSRATKRRVDQGSQQRIEELELELRAKEEYLQTTLEEMETANEELKSTNEEMQSVNEELQSTNEELETSKEELQSVNEELATVNTELQNKVSDLSRANNDMNNLLAGTGVATLFVDHDLRITRFTPAATQLIKLIPSDIGRSVGDIVSNLVGYTHFIDDLHAVLQTLAPLEREVHTDQGHWYLMRIGPYRTLENVIEGAVITFIDISAGAGPRILPAIADVTDQDVEK